MSEILSITLSIGGAAAGIYGAIRAWLSDRKMKQIEEEKLATKLNIDFNYELIKSGDEKICRGVIKWSNLGLANVKIIKLNIDIRDRIDEMCKSYLPPENSPDFCFKPLSERIEQIELKGINNHKFVNFSNNPETREIKIFQDDLIYGLELSSKEKRRLKEIGAEIDLESLRIKKNIVNYINNKIDRLKKICSNKDIEACKKDLTQFLFYDTLIKDLRSIQLFPGQTMTQEFFLSYKGEGMVYLNVESATIRLQMKNVDAIEKYKNVCDQILDSGEISDSLIKKFENSLKLTITPAAMEIYKQKSNFLLYLK